MFSWLVGSSGRIETQVQSLKRRCTQFGLRLVPFPHISTSTNLFIQPFKAPAIFTLTNASKAENLDFSLATIGFIHDGVFKTSHKPILDCIRRKEVFKFPTGRFNSTKYMNGRQLVHRSGTLFTRVLTDMNGCSIVVVIGNYRYLKASKDSKVLQQYIEAFSTLRDRLNSLQ